VFDRYDITSGADVRDGLGRLESAATPSTVSSKGGRRVSFPVK
jgi:hypothetical protein